MNDEYHCCSTPTAEAALEERIDLEDEVFFETWDDDDDISYDDAGRLPARLPTAPSPCDASAALQLPHKIAVNHQNEISSTPASLLPYGGRKAGMDKVDMSTVQRVIEEATFGTKFWDHQQKRESRIAEQINVLHQKTDPSSTLPRTLVGT